MSHLKKVSGILIWNWLRALSLDDDNVLMVLMVMCLSDRGMHSPVQTAIGSYFPRGTWSQCHEAISWGCWACLGEYSFSVSATHPIGHLRYYVSNSSVHLCLPAHMYVHACRQRHSLTGLPLTFSYCCFPGISNIVLLHCHLLCASSLLCSNFYYFLCNPNSKSWFATETCCHKYS